MSQQSWIEIQIDGRAPAGEEGVSGSSNQKSQIWVAPLPGDAERQRVRLMCFSTALAA
jgi:hypothetical protein